MKVFVFLTLFISVTLFAKVDYRFFPKNTTIMGYVATKGMMKNPQIKEYMKRPDVQQSMKTLLSMGVDIKKLGAISFYSNADSLIGKDSKAIKKDGNYAIILHGLNLENLIKSEMKKNKDAKSMKYKGYTVYLKLEAEDGKKKVDAVTFIEGNTVMGSVPGVKNVIDAYKGKRFANKKLVNSLLKKLNNPDFFVIDLVDAKQRQLILQSLKAKKNDPTVAMLGLENISKNLELLVFAGKIIKDRIYLYAGLQSDKGAVKIFINNTNMQFNAFKPMLAQQVNAYKPMLGNDGAIELNSILNSIKFEAQNKLGLMSLFINLKRVSKALKKMNTQVPNLNIGK